MQLWLPGTCLSHLSDAVAMFGLIEALCLNGLAERTEFVHALFCWQDLNRAMVSSGVSASGEPGKSWSYLQILVVVPSEVDNYKRFGPRTAAIFALPIVSEHMGIGCARYFTKKLAETICPKNFQVCLVMDDSVQYWSGITLPDDPLKPFGIDAVDKSQR